MIPADEYDREHRRERERRRERRHTCPDCGKRPAAVITPAGYVCRPCAEDPATDHQAENR